MSEKNPVDDAEVAVQVNELERLAEAAGDAPGGAEYVPGDEAGTGSGTGPETGDILAPVLQITFGVVAAKRGQLWALTDQEATELGRAYGAVLDKYFPDAANRFGVEITAVMVTLAAFGPRLIEEKRRSQEDRGAQDGGAEAKGEGETAGGVDGD